MSTYDQIEEVDPTVSLRPVEEADLLVMAEVAADPERVGAHNFAGETDSAKILDRLRKRFEVDGMLGTSSGHMAVILGEDREAELVGDVAWRLVWWGSTLAGACPTIGISLMPERRGRGIGTAAQRLFVAHLFQQTPANRIQANTALDNIAEQRALVKAGFSPEGIVRGCEWRSDRWHDHALYGITRADWETIQAQA